MITKTITSTAERESFYSIARESAEDSVPVAVRNRGRRSVVIIPERECNSTQETLYVTRGGRGEQLLRAREQARRGETTPITLDDIECMLVE